MLARIILVFALLVPPLVGCGTTPAKPRPAAHVQNVVVPNGEYEVEFHSPWAGPVRGRMTFEALPDGFKANTRPGVAWEMVGGIESVLGPVFMPFLFPRGMILVWSSRLPSTDPEGGTVPGDGTIGAGDFESLRVRTQFVSAEEPVIVRLRDGRAVGVMTLRKADPGSSAATRRTDYPALAHRTGELLREHLFDRKLLESGSYKSAWRGFLRNAEKARDDAEFLFGGIVAFRSNLTTSMPLLFPRPTPEISGPLVDGLDDLARTYRVEHDEKTGLTTVRFYAFLEPAFVDDAMSEALTHRPRGLVVDLRRCPGITLAALRLASLLLREPAHAGIVFLPEARDKASAPTVPEGLPTVQGPWRGADILRVDELLADRGVVELSVLPDLDASTRFDGPVAVLTSRRTSASAELLVHVLRSAGRALVVGDYTAGRPMLAREFDAGQGWTLLVPALDHRPREGPRLNGRGVEPDRRATRNAPGVAARMLIERIESSRQ